MDAMALPIPTFCERQEHSAAKVSQKAQKKGGPACDCSSGCRTQLEIYSLLVQRTHERL